MNTNIKQIQTTLGCFIVILVAIAVLGHTGCAAAETSSNHAQTQVLYYLVGSDLESKGGDATKDLMKVIESYKDADPKKLDVVVAFGGSKKAGWQGMKIATGAQLIKDGKDGKFGNGNDYLYSNTSADMGSGWSYQKFITVARTSRTASRTILIISDHGGSYGGIGQDERTLELLQMNDIDKALNEGGIKSDPFIFDACLMASVEVAKTVQPYTTLQLGSENFAFGSYNYSRVIAPLVSKPGEDSESHLKGIAEDYLDDDRYVMTMSIINTSKVPALREGLGTLGTKLVSVSEDKEGLHDLKGAYNNAIKVGVSNGKPTAVDLVSLLKNIKQKRPELATEVDAAITLTQNAVVYEKHNKKSKAVSGISIASPDAMDLKEYNKYGEGIKIATDWDSFFVKMIEESQAGNSATTSDIQKSAADVGPFITGSNVPADDEATDSLSKPGFAGTGNGEFELLDPYEDASVFAAYYRIDNSGTLSIGTQPIELGSNGLYQIPQWDGQWYYIPGSAGNSQPILFDMEYDGITDGGYSTYYSGVTIENDGYHNNATVTTFVDGSTGQCDIMITPYTVTEEGGEIYGRTSDQFENGALVTSYSTGINWEGQESGVFPLAHTTVVPGMAMEYKLLPDGTYAAGIMAYYDDDNVVLADQFRIITIRNGALVNTSIGPLPHPQKLIIADFTVSPVSGTAPLTVQCSDASVGSPTVFSYNFGDGTTSRVQNPVHTYKLPGTYDISLTVMKFDKTTNSMVSDNITKESIVTVTKVAFIPPVADFTASPVQGSAPLTVRFTDQSSGNPTFFNYNFGDGVNMTGPNPVHTYRYPGNYSVTLTVMKKDASNGSMVGSSSVQKDLIVVKSK